uniref:Uncharacterized protein n=1 Tax=Anguilla anguilla TaxID=7936 RepID=A0A0E9WSI1_ANGAN
MYNNGSYSQLVSFGLGLFTQHKVIYICTHITILLSPNANSSLITESWTVGSLSHEACGGVSSVVIFRHQGDGGSSNLPQRFSLPPRSNASTLKPAPCSPHGASGYCPFNGFHNTVHPDSTPQTPETGQRNLQRVKETSSVSERKTLRQ